MGKKKFVLLVIIVTFRLAGQIDVGVECNGIEKGYIIDYWSCTMVKDEYEKCICKEEYKMDEITFYKALRAIGTLVKYVSFHLNDELKMGVEYKLEIDIKFNYKISDYRFKVLSYKFLKENEFKQICEMVNNYETTHKWLEGDGFIELSDEDTTWQRRSSTYVARGGEKWIILGLMKNKNDTEFQVLEDEITEKKRKGRCHTVSLAKLEIYVEKKYMEDNLYQEDYISDSGVRPIVIYQIGCISLKQIEK